MLSIKTVFNMLDFFEKYDLFNSIILNVTNNIQ